MENKQNTLWLDLDETLVNSVWVSTDISFDYNVERYGEHWDHVEIRFDDIDRTERYVTFLRTWSRELVTFCKNLVGVENVFILSTGLRDYVKEINKRLTLGVMDENIYGREDIKKFGNRYKSTILGHPDFKGRNSVLLDNENYQYHDCGTCNKVTFLDDLPEYKFLQVPHFMVSSVNPKDDDEYLDILKDRIVRALANKN